MSRLDLAILGLRTLFCIVEDNEFDDLCAEAEAALAEVEVEE